MNLFQTKQNSASLFMLILLSFVFLCAIECRNSTSRFIRRGPFGQNISTTTTTSRPSTTTTIATTPNELEEEEEITSTEAPPKPKTTQRKRNRSPSSSVTLKQVFNDTNVVDKWKDLEMISQNFAFRFVYNNLLPSIETLFIDDNVSSRCQTSIKTVLSDASRLKKYAIQSKCHFILSSVVLIHDSLSFFHEHYRWIKFSFHLKRFPGKTKWKVKAEEVERIIVRVMLMSHSDSDAFYYDHCYLISLVFIQRKFKSSHLNRIWAVLTISR